MRASLRLGALGLFLSGIVAGCGGTNVEQGVPRDVDFSKDYSPAAKPLTFDPKGATVAKQKAAAFEKEAAAKEKAAANP
jgi:hypothetical protein